MSTLPIRRMTLYKHGLGSFQRAGLFSGTELRLTFPRRAMNDVLKSLVALDLAQPGAVLGLSFETPPDRNSAMHKALLAIDPRASLLDFLTALRGRVVRCRMDDGASLQGAVLGVQVEQKNNSGRSSLLLHQGTDDAAVVLVDLQKLFAIDIVDELARADMQHLLRAARSDEEREQTLLKLSPGEHDLRISYIAPAPAWRVSYRLLLEGGGSECELLLQALGLFDNTLDEDLQDIELSLVAGMPVSFQYLLHAPNTPTRATVEDETRTVDAPIQFEARSAKSATKQMRGPAAAAASQMDYMMSSAMELSDVAQSVEPVATGEDRGALFAYKIANKVSVGRGQSAMVPLLSQMLKGQRELLYNGRKQPSHPVASVRFKNTTGLTLERGPLTVFDRADYAGEAVMAFTAAEADVLVAFAVDLGVVVQEQTRHEQRTATLVVQQGGIFRQDWQYQITEYRLTSKRDQACLVTVEHNRQMHYEIAQENAPDADVTELSYARWQVPLGKFAKATLVVSERISQGQHLQLEHLSEDLLEQYLRNGQIDQVSLAKLKAAFLVRQKLQPVVQELQSLQAKRHELAQQQARLRDNMVPLKDTGPEAALRARFASEMGRAEDDIQALQQQEASLITQRDALLQAQLAALR